MKPADRWAKDALKSIGDNAYREAEGKEPELGETAWSINRLSDEGLERLATFLIDLTRRAPLSGPAWVAHRDVLSALEADIRRELAKREGEPRD